MILDKHKLPGGDGYEFNGVFYETAESLIQTGLLDFCGCGAPHDNLIYIRDGLTHLKRLTNKGRDCLTDFVYDIWAADGLHLFGNASAQYFFWYWAAKEGLTEHGGAVPGWLTDKGQMLLSDLQELLKDDVVAEEE